MDAVVVEFPLEPVVWPVDWDELVVVPVEPLWFVDDPVEPFDVLEFDAVVVELPVDVLLLPLVDPLPCELLPEVLAVAVVVDDALPLPFPLPPALPLPDPVELFEEPPVPEPFPFPCDVDSTADVV